MLQPLLQQLPILLIFRNISLEAVYKGMRKVKCTIGDIPFMNYLSKCDKVKTLMFLFRECYSQNIFREEGSMAMTFKIPS